MFFRFYFEEKQNTLRAYGIALCYSNREIGSFSSFLSVPLELSKGL